MAVKETITIEAKVDEAVRGVNEVRDSVDELKNSQSEATKQSKEQTKQLGILGKAAKGIQRGFKGIGLALKGLGIGLVLKAFEVLVDIFNQNQTVVDAFTTAFNFLSLAFNDFFSFIEKNIGFVIEGFKALFDDPIGNIQRFGDILQKYFVNAFKQALNAAEAFGGAIAALFRGDFSTAATMAREGVSELADALVGVEEGGAKKLKEGMDKLTKSVVDYTKNTYDAAKSITELNKEAEVAAAVNQGLIEKYDRQAEKLRQIRDDDRKTITDRIKANEDLSDVLDDQEKAMKANAAAIVAAAQAEFDRNKSTENYVALIQAQNEKAAISAQIEGFRSEQKSNYNALLREEEELKRSIVETDQEVEAIEAEIAIAQEDNALKRLMLEKDLNQQIYENQKSALEAEKLLYDEGTQYYQDIVNQLNVLDAERKRQAVETDKSIQEERDKIRKEELEREMALQRAKAELTSMALGALLENLEEGSAAAKAVAVAQATFDTYQAIQSTFASAAANPTSILFPAQPYIQAGIAAAFGFANVRKILSTNTASASGGGSGSIPTGGAPQPPTVAFNTLQGVGNQITEAINGSANRPVQAYVTTQSIDNANQLNRKVNNQASFG